MHTRTTTVLALLAALALPVTPAAATDDADIAQRVATAKTAADHQALAAYYSAAEYDAMAAAHRALAQAAK